jgi:transposase
MLYIGVRAVRIERLQCVWRYTMTRRQKDPLRTLTQEERRHLEHLSRASSAPAAYVARAKSVLAVAAGHSYTAAVHLAGRRSGDAVAHLVARFNKEGMSAIESRHGGGPVPIYTERERERILSEAQRPPKREEDHTATWSLKTLQHALRVAADGLPNISTYTIWCVLRDAGWSWQQARSWCPTGTAWRKRQGKLVLVRDPDTEPKKS